jgi:Mg2+-importing ATPase
MWGLNRCASENMKDMATDLKDHYWAVPTEQVVGSLKATTAGLSQAEAAERLAAMPSDEKKQSKLLRDFDLFVGQFKSPIIMLLMIAAVLSFFLGEKVDCLIIFIIVMVSGLLGFFQEQGAENAVEGLLSLIQVNCKVIRDGKELEVPTHAVVPGDVIVLSAGSTVPADAIIIESKELFVDEAPLTGETLPAEKHAGKSDDDCPLSRRSNCVFQGTHVISGYAKILAVFTGKDTEFGKISSRLNKRGPETEFERGIKTFGYFLMEVTFVLVIVIFAVNVFLHRPVLDSFMFSLALAIGLTPQLLPAVISVNLATGARRMANAKVIVKRLSSIETFGSMNLLCSDKTGTITEGVLSFEGALDVDGKPSDYVKKLAHINASLETGFVNPMDQALREQAATDIAGYTKLDEIPYDFTRKRLTVLVSDGSNQGNLLITKGALSNVLSVCDTEYGDKPQKLMEELSEQGKRTIGVAYRRINAERVNVADEQNMTFAGVLAFSDPPKKSIVATIENLNKLGVKLKVITGDNAMVAQAVARQVGLHNPKIMTSTEMHSLDGEALARRVNDVDVFAEVEPSQKEQIILALKRAGNVVGYVGDGINDAPALHAADVGISVNNAVDVAKEAAQIVLMEHDLQVLVEGIRQGRMTFANTMKYIFLATSANFGNMFSMAGASLFLPFLPLLPKQILLTNLMTDFPQMTIATDDCDAEQIEKPRRWNIKEIQSFMLVFGLISSIFDYATFIALITLLHGTVEQFRTAWFVESVVSASLAVLVIRTRRSVFASKPSKLLVLATAFVILLTCALPFVKHISVLGFAPLTWHYYVMIAALVAGYMLTAELAKRSFYRAK